MISGLYAGLCGVLLIVLAGRVIQRRLSAKIGLGSGGDDDLERRIRAHANFIEYTPVTLLLLYLVEQSGAGPAYVHAFGATFVIARVLHAQGLSGSAGRSPGRFFGTLASLLVILGLSGWLIASALT
jgi:uncharacterized membrane protein YecN with MAPEG domain